ncbi:MAG: plasma-membrane proton-efflux P-type ATPase [Patescibacteria group bacterium]|nr:plasma-membrane proton-efflux P-type ATPase [Patescibacteria group bacterium]MDE2116584.1 plasma-membrane proton-efflux P-type ATPase [Patescibacteria group bacterium]
MDINTNGLSSAEARERLAKYGHNVIEEKKRSIIGRLAKKIVSPMSLMFLAAGVLSLWAHHISDAIIIAGLFLVNIGVSVWHEAKADTALEKLRAKLAVIVKVKRDGAWAKLPSSELVLGDIIELSTGSIIPADVSFAATKNVSVNEAVVTGESLPKQKVVGDTGYSGAFLSTGLAEATVTATGAGTYFGKTIALVDTGRRRSHLEEDILSVSRFLSIISVVVMVILTVVLVLSKLAVAEIATLDISLLIAGIPVALPTVMTLIISVGVTELAKKAVIVRRLSSLEDLANVNLLLSDKTGTLTENRIEATKIELIAAEHMKGKAGASIAETYAWALALAASPDDDSNPLDAAIRIKAKESGAAELALADFIPGDSERKRATAIIEDSGRRRAVSLGASRTIRDLCSFGPGERERYDAIVDDAAREGFRVLALAESANEKEEQMKPVGIVFLADAIRADAVDTIKFMNEYGIDVKMVTGDGYEVSAHVARALGLSGRIVRRDELESRAAEVKKEFPTLAGFAEVMPKDKYDMVMDARNAGRNYTVAVTGDGVNDVPPVKAADVGIAVANAVDALKGTADIVLTSAGIAVIKDAIIEARKVFVRLYNYSLYRISESFRLIITVAVIGVIFHTYPLTAIQIILIALLNDLPIISMAFDRVAVPRAPAAINARKRFALSTSFGLVGIANSMFLLWLALSYLHVPWPLIQTLFFLKLTVSGHMLIYVAHTEKPWYSFLPSKQVIWATTLTQIVATAIAYFGLLTAPVSLGYIILVWVWSFGWMQITELVKRPFFSHVSL